MAFLKLLSWKNKQEYKERVARQKGWGVFLIALFFVAGIVHAPFSYNEMTYDSIGAGNPKVIASDGSTEALISAGIVLSQNTQPSAASTSGRTSSSNIAYTPPTPLPVPFAPEIQLTIPVQQPLHPVSVPVPQPITELSPAEELPVCNPPTFSNQEVELTGKYTSDENSNTPIELEQPNNIYTYTASTEESCPLSWQPAGPNIVWSEDGLSETDAPLQMIVASKRNPETSRYHGNALQFSFVLGAATSPISEQTFTFAVYHGNNAEPTQHTIKVKVITAALVSENEIQ